MNTIELQEKRRSDIEVNKVKESVQTDFGYIGWFKKTHKMMKQLW